MKNKFKSIIIAFLFIAICPKVVLSQTIQMVFTSDAHYGITRDKFRGDTGVTGHVVNAALVKQISTLPYLTLPNDGGINAGNKVGGINYVIEGGDIANRMDIPVQTAAVSWSQFESDYMHHLTIKDAEGNPATLLMVPGNHDISNAIGFPKPMSPVTDPSSMVGIYNLMLKPAQPLTNDNYDYAVDKINYSRNIKGIHFEFITLWPDSAERIWMQHDLDTVAATTPVIIFTHDQPECEAKHFTNPLPPYNMTEKNKFQNLVSEHYKEGDKAQKDDGATDIEQRGFVKFLKAHRNIVAYFHGNSNWNEFYTYHGPDNDVSLNVFRVDSPMKGKYSSKDETKVSFQLISLDPQTLQLTVRECLWNTKPLSADNNIVFGKSATVSLKVN
ncbi:metallophosphoesterase [Mucilaginibacter sp. L196]|uniref:metallophosphoesterase n=1 Tax=Mucilaginibacter sp. L196 TaxID=1641870 RepID=UPI00131C8870|nr:metallophosphoesterase [Mucilaginibacter sp. L196]